MFNKRKMGKQGETAVVKFLEERSYEIIARNYQTRFGEIDIIAHQDETYCFVEVKTRASLQFGAPTESVIRRKQETIAKVASYFLMENELDDVNIRFDVASVLEREGSYEIDMMENAFEVSPLD